MKSDVCSGLCLCLLLWQIVELHSTKQNSMMIISSVQNISDHSRVFLCHPFPNKAEHTPRHIITNFQWMTHPSCSTIPPLHRHHSSIHPSILQPRRRDACFLPHLPHFLSLTAEILFAGAKAPYLPVITHHPSPDTASGVKPLPVPPSDRRSLGAIMSCPAPWTVLVHLELRSRPHGGTVRLLWMLGSVTWSCHSRLTMTHSGTVPLTGKAWHGSV